MFPFRTDIFSFNVAIGEEEIKKKMEELIAKERFLELRSGNVLYGRVKENCAVYTLGDSPNRNAFLPIVVLEWKNDKEKSDIKGYYRLDLRVIFFLLGLLISGGIISFQINNPLPLLFVFGIDILLLVLFYSFYERSKERMIRRNNEELVRLLKRLETI